jgi:uncharacterized RDD family membrane protein YckC
MMNMPDDDVAELHRLAKQYRSPRAAIVWAVIIVFVLFLLPDMYAKIMGGSELDAQLQMTTLVAAITAFMAFETHRQSARLAKMVLKLMGQ